MSVEAPEQLIVDDRLELEHRNELQKIIIEKYLEKTASELSETDKFQKELDWALKFSGKISDYIDHGDNGDVRELAREEKYQEAVDLLCSRHPELIELI